MQLLAEPLEEALRAEADEMNGPGRPAHLQALTGLNRLADLAVERDEHVVSPRRDRLDRDDRRGRQDERLDPAAFGALAGNGGLEREPRLGRIGPARNRIEYPVEGVRCRSREESDTSEIQSEYRRVGTIQQTRPAEQCAIATQRDEAVQISR